MPVFTAAAVYIAGTIGVTSVLGIAAINLGVRIVAAYVVSDLISKRNPTQPGVVDTTSAGSGTRVQLSPATNNKLPIVYGTAYISPIVVDAKLSTDQKTMWYVMALSEASDAGGFTFTRQWWGDKELFFDSGDPTRVATWIDSSDNANFQIDGNMFIYYYSNGSNDPTNTALTAIQVLQDAGIEPALRWEEFNLMSNTAFAIVKINFNQDAGITGADQFKVEMTNSLSQPGLVILDYMSNTVYGCAIDNANIDTEALDELNAYSDELIEYTPTGGGPTETQERYRINGPLSTNNSCLTNLQLLVDACDSWLRWDEVNNKWSVIINRSYEDYTTYEDLFQITSDNIVGGVDITPLDLNSTYNSVEVQFPNNKIRDQSDYVYINLPDQDLLPNEPINILNLSLPLVNNSVQATYIGTRRLIQNREDLIVSLSTDYSGIQVEAGDIVRVRHPVYGWGPIESNPANPDKLFIVNQVIEAKTEDGNLGTRLSLFEYNEQVFANTNIEDYTPEMNTGIPSPNWITKPDAPFVTFNSTPGADGAMSSFTVTATIPNSGTVLYMDFYYGTTIDDSTHKLYRTVGPTTGRAFINGSSISITVNDLSPGTYYWSVRARSSVSSSGTNPGSQASSTSAPNAWQGAKMLLPALVGGALLGGISTALLKPKAVTPEKVSSELYGIIKTMAFSPISQPPGYPSGTFWDVTTAPANYRNLPLVIPGVSVPGTEIWPWAQGTGPTSTAPWLPAGARAQGFTEGDDGWYKMAYWDVSDDPIEAGVDRFNANLFFEFLTDTPNTTFQIVLYLSFVGSAFDMVIQWATYFGEFTITEAEPHPYTVPINVFSGLSSGTGVEIGFAIRNMTPSSNLYLVSGGGIYDARAWPNSYEPWV
jgi:hypothetical protein